MGFDRPYVNLGTIIDEFSLGISYLPDNGRNISITIGEINRPGLAFAGYFERFEPARIQLVGIVEQSYVRDMDAERRKTVLIEYFSRRPVAVILTSGNEPLPEMTELAEYYEVPLLKTEKKTSEFMSALISSLNLHLAPRITMHGVLVEVYGEGILILGDSGIGKSEAAIELIKRGHRLIADDAVIIKRVSAISLVGSSPELIQYYVELRGIGIVDVRRIFGMGAVKQSEKINMIIKLETWVEGKMYDRFGLETEFTDILGIKIPTTTVPVRSGRNLAVIIEIAAMNNRQKMMGYNTAEEFNKKLVELYGPDVDISGLGE
ncbi:MAG: HPr(Ser) kinase/phosphatase [Firmicutes bacterium]|nr:HPr(Ser) kinase/phosphatase [Bacillota bacterium]